MQCCSPPTPRDVSVLFYELLHCRALEDLHRCCSHSCFQDRMAACNQPPQQVDSPCLPCVKLTWLTLPHWLTTSSSITAVTPENTDASRGHVVYPLTCPVHIFFWCIISYGLSYQCPSVRNYFYNLFPSNTPPLISNKCTQCWHLTVCEHQLKAAGSMPGYGQGRDRDVLVSPAHCPCRMPRNYLLTIRHQLLQFKHWFSITTWSLSLYTSFRTQPFAHRDFSEVATHLVNNMLHFWSSRLGLRQASRHHIGRLTSLKRWVVLKREVQRSLSRVTRHLVYIHIHVSWNHMT